MINETTQVWSSPEKSRLQAIKDNPELHSLLSSELPGENVAISLYTSFYRLLLTLKDAKLLTPRWVLRKVKILPQQERNAK